MFKRPSRAPREGATGATGATVRPSRAGGPGGASGPSRPNSGGAPRPGAPRAADAGGRRTVTITGRGAERYNPRFEPGARPRPQRRRHERTRLPSRSDRPVGRPARRGAAAVGHDDGHTPRPPPRWRGRLCEAPRRCEPPRLRGAPRRPALTALRSAADPRFSAARIRRRAALSRPADRGPATSPWTRFGPWYVGLPPLVRPQPRS